MNLTAPVIFPDFFVSNVFLIPPIFGTSFSYYYGWSFCWFSPTVSGVWGQIRGKGFEFLGRYFPSENSEKVELGKNWERIVWGVRLTREIFRPPSRRTHRPTNMRLIECEMRFPLQGYCDTQVRVRSCILDSNFIQNGDFLAKFGYARRNDCERVWSKKRFRLFTTIRHPASPHLSLRRQSNQNEDSSEGKLWPSLPVFPYTAIRKYGSVFACRTRNSYEISIPLSPIVVDVDRGRFRRNEC